MEIYQSKKSLGQLISLVHLRWNIPLIAVLYRDSGAKFITLVNQLMLSRTSLSNSLDYLIKQEWVCRNPGYGHPMRPEYVLTSRGLQAGRTCLALVRIIEKADQAQLAFCKWTLPTVAAMGTEQLRFMGLRAALPTATPRALTLCLKAMVLQQWAKRTVIENYPPTASYSLNTFGHRIFEHVVELA